jgi:pimeloyl-ACP methyl ester carboxylesterase
MPTIQANGADFYYETYGKGKPIILISGYACDHTIWLPMIDYFSPHFKVITFDNRGVGLTKDDHRSLTIDLMADDVIALSDALHLERPHILGGSMGGSIAQSIGCRYSDKIGKIVLLVTSSKWRKAMLFNCETLLKMRREKQIDQNYITDLVLSSVFGENFFQNKKNIDLFRRLFKENPQPVADQERQFHALKEFDLKNSLHQIDTPTLIVNGMQDVMSLPYESKYLADHIPNSTWISLDCGHGCTFEIPEELSKNILSFLFGT